MVGKNAMFSKNRFHIRGRAFLTQSPAVVLNAPGVALKFLISVLVAYRRRRSNPLNDKSQFFLPRSMRGFDGRFRHRQIRRMYR